MVKEIMLRWENQTGQKVKSFRTDRGIEFVNIGMSEFCVTKGIFHQTSAPYTPQQNGKVERVNRTIKERVGDFSFRQMQGMSCGQRHCQL